jgi:hypothetical protein
LRLQLYRKLFAITYSNNYWDISRDCREYIEKYYVLEEIYADKLEKFPRLLTKVLTLHIIQTDTAQLGMLLFNKLRFISFELRTVKRIFMLENVIQSKFLWFMPSIISTL